jgi:epoxyqueuosine reductase
MVILKEDELPVTVMDIEMPKNLANWIKLQAHTLGFTLVGITSPDPPAHLEVYQAWIEAGRHAGMDYLAREDAIAKRGDPRLILPDCQSILVLGTTYPTHTGEIFSNSGFRIATYALGTDYHSVFNERCTAMIQAIETHLGSDFPHRFYTDTGPLLERELAQRAGLGWIGKNTCLIHPKHGSYFLLAEILLGLNLQPDLPFTPDHCGSCTRCIDACPTHCILPDRTLDASRCISYLTIEHKGSISNDVRPLLGDWLFGCDICQQVCPWNIRFSKQNADPAFQLRPALQDAQLGDFLRLASGSWRISLRDSPLERPRRRGLVRNAAVVAGNQADPGLIADLTYVLHHDPEPLARAHAAWALGQYDSPQIRALLGVHLENEADPQVCREIQNTLDQS